MREVKWIELIRVRSSFDALQGAMSAVQSQIGDIEKSHTDAETFVMQHAIYDGDLAVSIVWRNNKDPHQTREGLMVAEKLQQLGSVDHAVWIPAIN